MSDHILYTDADADAPEQIGDSNGQVVLSQCKVCGCAEIELDEPCRVITTLRAEVERLGGLVYAPGRWKCVKCDFTLLQSNLNAATGNVTARHEAGGVCPNCNSPLWRVSWKAEAQENQTISETQFDRAMAAEAERDSQQRLAIAAIARAEKAEAALSGSIGYMMNAAIDLETGAPKKTALATINGGIKMARAALASLTEGE